MHLCTVACSHSQLQLGCRRNSYLLHSHDSEKKETIEHWLAELSLPCMTSFVFDQVLFLFLMNNP